VGSLRPLADPCNKVTARFYAEQILPKASALLPIVRSGASTTFELDEEQF
jgi:hypothetical protein